MKKTSFLLLAIAALLSFTACKSCKDDPFPLDLHTFDVRWFDDDNSGTQTAGDALTFGVEINSTDPDSDSQYVTDWEFTYYVNGNYGGLLRGDDHIETNSLYFDAEIIIGNLALPGIPFLEKGDVVEFRIWARDNHGTELEHTHRYIIED